MFNAAYIDITTLYYSVFTNHKPTVHYTQAFFLGAGVLIEISTVMILLSRILKYRANRWANIIAGVFLSVVQLVTPLVKRRLWLMYSSRLYWLPPRRLLPVMHGDGLTRRLWHKQVAAVGDRPSEFIMCPAGPGCIRCRPGSLEKA